MLGFRAVRKVSDEHNAPMESFFYSLKTERVHHRIYIEGFYNSRRLHSALGYISPALAEHIAA